MTDLPQPDPEPRRRRRLVADLTPLRANPTYRRWWIGYSVSNIGSQLTVVAAQLQVFHITHSSFDVGVTGLVTVIPLIVFGLFGGSIADAVDRRKLLLVTSTALMATTSLLLLQAAMAFDRLSIIYVLLGLQAGISSVDSAARGATLPRLVGAEQLPAANSLGQLGWNTALTLGPLLAGSSSARPATARPTRSMSRRSPRSSTPCSVRRLFRPTTPATGQASSRLLRACASWRLART